MRHYVSTAEPVGSKSLASGYNLKVSSATIRSVMSALEASGLLYQPHTSAGRIPSDSGYRAYVNELMEPSRRATHRMTLQMENTLSQRIGSRPGLNGPLIESLLQESAQMIASLSGYIALVTLPQGDEAKIQHLQLVQVSDRQILLVVVLDVYNNHSILLPLPSATEGAEAAADIGSELQMLSNFLTHQLKGKSLEAAALDWPELDQALDRALLRYASGLQRAIGDLSVRSRTNPATQIIVSGLAEVLDQPEFSERSQVRSIIQLLEDGRDQLWPLISAGGLSAGGLSIQGLSGDSLEAANPQRLRIWIGEENPVAPMQSCALVTAMYGKAPGPVGSLGVLGPTRMLYENAIAVVEAAANYLTDVVASTLELEAIELSSLDSDLDSNNLTPES